MRPTEALDLAIRIFSQMPETASIAELEQEIDRQLSAQPDSLKHVVKQAMNLLKVAYRQRDPEVPSPGTPGAFSPGVLLGGRYELLSQYPDGGMGEVWKAKDLQIPSRIVIVKSILVVRSSAAAENRFAREVFALSQLQSPFVVRYLDHFLDHDTHRQCLVMEYLDGTPVSYTGGETVSVRDLVQRVLLVCDGLETAHSCGFVHRDLKPANVLITKDGFPKIIDFGLVRMLRDSFPGAYTLTDHSDFGGSWQYASPEQASGLHNATFSSDVYSLGIILFELLTGRLPYGTSTPNRQNLLDRVAQHKQPDSLPPRLIGGHRSDPLLTDIIAHALALNPVERYRWAAEFGNDLRVWLNRHARGNRPPSVERPLTPAYRFIRRRRRRWAALATVLSTTLITFAAYLGVTLRALREEERKSQAALAIAAEVLSEADPYDAIHMSPSLARSTLQRAVPLLDRHKALLGEQEWTLRMLMAGATLSLGDSEDAVTLYDALASQLKGKSGEGGRLHAAALLGRGIALTNLDRRDDAAAALAEALEAAQTSSSSREFIGACLKARAVLAVDCQDYRKAEQLLANAAQHYDSASPAAELGRSAIALIRAQIEAAEQLTSEWRAHYDNAIESLQVLLGPDNLEVLRAKHALLVAGLEDCIRNATPGDGLVKPATEYRASFERAFGPESDDTAISAHCLCRLLTRVGRLDDALDVVNRVIDIRDKAHKKHDMMYARLLSVRGGAYLMKGNAASVSDFREAKGIITLYLGTGSPEYAQVITNLGVALFKSGSAPEAVVALQDAIDVNHRIHGGQCKEARGARLYYALALGRRNPCEASRCVEILESLVVRGEDGSCDAIARGALKELPSACEAAEYWRQYGR